MSKNKKIKDNVTVEEVTTNEVAVNQDTEIPTPWTESEIKADPAAYKHKFNIPANANLAWALNELPRYFRQGDAILFRHALQIAPGPYTTPIWYQVISAPAEVAIMEDLLNARLASESAGLKIAN